VIVLDELKDDTMLTVQTQYCDFKVMTKAEFLDSADYLDMDKNDKDTIPEVTVAEKVIHVFNWESVVENFEEESFEDFGDEFWNSISADGLEILNLAKEIVNRGLEANPTWYEGKRVKPLKKDSPNA
jgi:hypothetical protein